MPRAPASPELKARALKAIKAGLSPRAAATQLGVSATSVVRWTAEAEAITAPPSVPPPPPDAPAEAPFVMPEGGTLEAMRRTIVDLMRRGHAAEQVGNHAAAVTATKAAGELQNNLARLEAGQKEDAERFSMTRAEIDAQREKIRERVTAYQARGLRCEDCGRVLAAQWGGIDVATFAEPSAECHSNTPVKPRGV